MRSFLSKIAFLLETNIKTKKIHRVFEFNQSQWLKPYIEVSTEKRTETKRIEAKME